MHFHSDCSKPLEEAKPATNCSLAASGRALDTFEVCSSPSTSSIPMTHKWFGLQVPARDRLPTARPPSSPLTGCRQIAPALMYFSKQEASEHFPNGKAMLQGLHPRAKLQLDSTRRGQSRWDSRVSPPFWYWCLSAPVLGCSSSLTQLKPPDLQKQTVLYWISGLNQPRV